MAETPTPADPKSRATDRAAAGALLALVLGTVVLAAALPAARPAGPPSTPNAFRDDATCLEWTDDCVICTREPALTDGRPSCSTPGIACERRAPRCLRRS